MLLAAGLAGCASAPSPAAQAAPPTPEPTAAATPPAPEASPVPDVTIAAVGDLMLARRVETLMLERGAAYPFERVRLLLSGADLVIGNMEGTFTDRGTPLLKQYTFRTAPSVANGLATAGFDAVSLANNHASDFGLVSLEDTRASLHAAGVRTFGAGTTQQEAESGIVLRTATGARVALLGFSDIGEVVFATASQGGVARADTDAIQGAVRAAGAEADYVVLVAHWGSEYTSAPTARQRELARAAIEAGADVVLGAHPHVLQPLERFGDGLVVYSLGNFVFDLYEGELISLGQRPFESVVARVSLSKTAPPRVEFAPVRIDPGEVRPRPATTDEAASILDQLRMLAPPPLGPPAP